MSSSFFEFVSTKADHPAVTGTLLTAGAVPQIVPDWFSSVPMQNIYYLFLLPPAAWSCYVWFKRNVWPVWKRWRNKD